MIQLLRKGEGADLRNQTWCQEKKALLVCQGVARRVMRLSSTSTRAGCCHPLSLGKVLDSIFDAALNDDHKNQAAAWKLVMDRILPTAVFENDVIKGAGKSAIQINITGVGGAETTVVSGNAEDVIDDGEIIDG